MERKWDGDLVEKKIVNCLLDDICHFSVAESGTKRDRTFF